jgi:hypothetical protein
MGATVSKTTAVPQPQVDLTTIAQQLDVGAVESLVRFYATGAEIELRAPEKRRNLGGPIGLREGLERIVAADLEHELRLAAISYGGSYVLDRCRDRRTGKTVAWGGLTIRGGLVVRHCHNAAWDAGRWTA